MLDSQSTVMRLDPCGNTELVDAEGSLLDSAVSGFGRACAETTREGTKAQASKSIRTTGFVESPQFYTTWSVARRSFEAAGIQFAVHG